jgi:hypothetical protein
MPIVSITRLRVRSWRYLPAFVIQSIRAARQARAAAGNLSVGLLRDADFAFWTRTLWTDETPMRAFMLSGTHRTVMPRLLQWCDEAAVVHWTQESSVPPSWPEAHRRLRQDGRRSKVNHPSPAQERFDFPAPRRSGAAR